MQTSTIHSLSQLIEEIDFGLSFAIFRGQVDSSWEIAPSIFRYGPKIENFNYQSWRNLEDLLLGQFKLQAIPFMEQQPKNDLEWIIHAQHHGLPTRLVDWSHNPLKALYFALDDETFDGVDGALYRHTGHGISINPDKFPALDNIEHLIAFQPPKINHRILAQEGVFTAFPFPIEKDTIVYLDSHPFFEHERRNIIKYIIPSRLKPIFRKQLHTLGVKPSTIYPGLDGVASDIKSQWVNA